jgi:large subunit ribosomal protein L6
MSRVGKNPVAIPDGVSVTVNGSELSVKGKNGERVYSLTAEVAVTVDDGSVIVAPVGSSKKALSMWGTTRSLVRNMVVGVSEGFVKILEIQGVGYKAQVQGSNLLLSLGFSHDVTYAVPNGIKIKTPQPTQIEVSGSDNQKVGQVAAEIRSYRPPEPYKGKGVRYKGEYVIRKEGKKK